jgi:hypothetical protein
MQWMSNWSSLSQIAVIAGLVVAIALILVVIYRVAFGRRLRVPGGSRARQPRLGLVDAFSLDGQRQLVLVRRDNVEHLVMIGGPNDVLVESQIIRAAASPAARERDAAAVKALPIAPVHALGDAPAVAIEPTSPPAEPAPPPPPQQRPRIAPRFEAPAVKSAERAAPAPPAIRPAIRSVAPANGEARREFPSTGPVAPTPAAAPARAVAPAPAPAHPRPPLPPPIVVAPPARTRATPAPPPAPEAPAARPQPVARPPASETPAPAAKAPAEEAFGDLEALEAEMARLLGRDA